MLTGNEGSQKPRQLATILLTSNH